jgi:hypothetical protein
VTPPTGCSYPESTPRFPGEGGAVAFLNQASGGGIVMGAIGSIARSASTFRISRSSAEIW